MYSEIVTRAPVFTITSTSGLDLYTIQHSIYILMLFILFICYNVLFTIDYDSKEVIMNNK